MSTSSPPTSEKCSKEYALEREVEGFLERSSGKPPTSTKTKTGPIKGLESLITMPSSLSALPTTLLRLLVSPAGRAFIVSLSLWLLAYQYCRQQYWRDPHSAFFSSEHVYDLKYSAYRQSQAESFIASHNATSGTTKTASRHPHICAAFVTVKREEKQYVEVAVGSLLEGLTEEERRRLYLYVLFANTDPTVHPSWKGWLDGAADKVGRYDVDGRTLEHLKTLERERNWYEKGVFDYTYALDKCYATEAPYVVMFEDDIIVADGWMAKMRQALPDIEREVQWKDWLYLRLFYTETSMQWQATDFWYHHMSFTLNLGSLTGLALLLLVRYQFPGTRRHLDSWAIAVVCAVTIPAFIVLAFMIGKHSLFPPKGVFEMNKYGCCTQALVFPRHEIPGLVTYLRRMGAGQTDTMIEEYADANRKERLALAPQLVQHVGLQSSRDNKFVNSQSTWAFWFEEQDPGRLRKEHELLTGTLS